jgi:hypothetical protein
MDKYLGNVSNEEVEIVKSYLSFGVDKLSEVIKKIRQEDESIKKQMIIQKKKIVFNVVIIILVMMVFIALISADYFSLFYLENPVIPNLRMGIWLIFYIAIWYLYIDFISLQQRYQRLRYLSRDDRQIEMQLEVYKRTLNRLPQYIDKFDARISDQIKAEDVSPINNTYLSNVVSRANEKLYDYKELRNISLITAIFASYILVALKVDMFSYLFGFVLMSAICITLKVNTFQFLIFVISSIIIYLLVF